MATKSKIMGELTEAPAIVVEGERLPIERLPLRKIFRLVKLLQEGFGDFLDFVQGNLPPEVVERIARAESPEVANQIAQQHLMSTDASVNGHIRRLMEKEDVFFEVLALALGRDADWVADHVPLDQALRAVSLLIQQELTADFFGGVGSLRAVWSEAKAQFAPSTDGILNPIAAAGSGNLSPNSAPNGPILATPVPS